MNGPELVALREALAASRDMAGHLSRLQRTLAPSFPVDAALAGGSDPEVERFHGFLRMFEQLYDVTARQLFRGLLLVLSEEYQRLSFKEVVRRLERLQRLSDGNRWIALGETRNILVHDYAVTKTAFAEHLNRAWSDLDDLLRMHSEIVGHIEVEGVTS